MKMIVFLIIAEFINYLQSDDFICDKPHQVYHNSSNKASSVCSEGCEDGCYCKRGYKMNEYGECIPGDPRGEYFSYE